MWGKAFSATLSNLGNTVTDAVKSNRAATAAPDSNDSNYVRVPAESARKLHWYMRDDLSGLIRTNTREKREMLDAIAALKKLLIKAGYTDLKIDDETRQLVAQAEAIRKSDSGVNAVLLLSALDRIKQLERELETSGHAAPPPQHPNFSLEGPGESIPPTPPLSAPVGGRRAAPATAAAVPAAAAAAALAVQVYERAAAAAARLEIEREAAAAAVAELQRQEATAWMLEAERLRAREAQVAWDKDWSDAGPEAAAEVQSLQQQLSAEREQRQLLVARLQRMEAERRAAMDEMEGRDAEIVAALDAAEKLRDALAASDDRARAAAATAEQLQKELATVRAALRTAEEAAERRSGDVKPRVDLSRMQDITVEAAERAAASERRAALAEARCTKSDTALREAQDELRKLKKQLAQVKRECEHLQQKVAEGAANEAPAAETPVSATAASLATAEADRASALKEVAAARQAAEAAEARLQHAELREARMAAELHEAEAVAAEKVELSAQVAVLREKLEEGRAEHGQLLHYKQVNRELEEARQRAEEELVATARLVTQLEARLREAQSSAQAARTAAELAESRARAADAAVASEVERRLAAIGPNRRSWPPAAREEAERLEARLAALQAALSAAQQEFQVEAGRCQQEAKSKLDLQRRLLEQEDRTSRSEAGLRERVRELESGLEMAQQDADAARSVILKLEQEMNELLDRALHHSAPQRAQRGVSTSQRGLSMSPAHRSGSGGSLTTPSFTAASERVPNKVGGGSLYGVADSSQQQQQQQQQVPSLASEPSVLRLPRTSLEVPEPGSPASTAAAGERPKTEGVDVTYLKNVVLKFIEAQVMGRAQERDALLPAIATLLQATPAEFRLLKQITQNAQPNLLSAFGIKI